MKINAHLNSIKINPNTEVGKITELSQKVQMTKNMNRRTQINTQSCLSL